jgi:hypothetical protein
LFEALANDPDAPLTVPAEIAAALPVLIAHQRAELAPADDETLMAKLIALCAGIGMGMAQREKTEWQAWACLQLSKLPRGLALEGLEHASTVCDHPRHVVKEVFTYAETYPSRMRTRLQMLEMLNSRAQNGGN